MKILKVILTLIIVSLLLYCGILMHNREHSPILKPTGDDKDRTEEIVEKLNTYGYCQLEKGDYYISSHLWMPDDTSIKGVGSGSRLIWGDPEYSGVCITIGSNCLVEDIIFEGPLSATPTEYRNLTAFAVADNRIHFSISNVIVQRFMTGFLSLNNGTNSSNGGRFANCIFEECYYGINLGKHGEYNRVTNCQMNSCYMGAKVAGGNNIFVNCSFDHNYIGVKIAGGENSGHGSMIGCSFNHAVSSAVSNEYDNDVGYSIWAENYSNGFVISGCQVFFGKLRLKSIEGMTINACNFGRFNFSDSETGIPIEITDSKLVISDNLFKLPPEVNKTDTSTIVQSDNILITDGSEIVI